MYKCFTSYRSGEHKWTLHVQLVFILFLHLLSDDTQTTNIKNYNIETQLTVLSLVSPAFELSLRYCRKNNWCVTFAYKWSTERSLAFRLRYCKKNSWCVTFEYQWSIEKSLAFELRLRYCKKNSLCVTFAHQWSI